MTSFTKWLLGIALGLAVTGQLKSVTLKMARLAIEAQRHKISYEIQQNVNQAEPSTWPIVAIVSTLC